MSGYVTDNIKTPDGAHTQSCTATGGTVFRSSNTESIINTAAIQPQELRTNSPFNLVDHSSDDGCSTANCCAPLSCPGPGEETPQTTFKTAILQLKTPTTFS